MKHLFLLMVLLSTSPFLYSQTLKVQGTVREITHSASDPVVPVPDARVIIGSVSSGKTDAKGHFSMSVSVRQNRSFTLQDVRMPAGKNYLLASPARNERIFFSDNALRIALITPEEKEQVSKATYNSLFRKYRKQGNLLLQQRNELEDLQLELDESDARYRQLAVKIDSLQNLLDRYFDAKNKSTVTKTLEQVAEELALTDYQSLDSIDARIFQLKREGDWNSLSELLRKVMNGNVAAYLQEGVKQQQAAKAVLAAANRDLSLRFRRMEEAIHAFNMQYEKDSVSKYYSILIQADSTNIDYLMDAASHECEYMANFPLAMKYYSRARSLATTDSLRARIINWQGKVYLMQMNIPEALKYHLQALELQQSLWKEDHPELAETYHHLGVVYSYMGKNQEALGYLEKGLDIKKQHLREDHPELAMYYYALSSLYYKMQKMDDLKRCMFRCLEILKKNFGDDNSYLPYAYNGIGVSFRSEKNYAEAEKYLLLARDGWQRMFGKNHPMMSYSYNNLGELYEEMGKYEDAERYLFLALENRKKNFGEVNRNVALSYVTLGNFYYTTEKFDDALKYFNLALDIETRLYGENHYLVAGSYLNLGDVYEALGQYDKALDCYRKALDINKKVLEKKDPILTEIQDAIRQLEDSLKTQGKSAGK